MKQDDSPRELLVDFLISHPESPGKEGMLPERLPHTGWGLFVAAGWATARRGGRGFHGGPIDGYPRFIRWARLWPRLTEWLHGDTCFHPPEVWPSRVARHLPEWVTPRAWCLGMLPTDQLARKRGYLYNRLVAKRGLRHLHAYAHGWASHDLDVSAMEAAVLELLALQPFVIWAYNPRLEAVAMPFLTTKEQGTDRISFFDRCRARRRLETDPLGTAQWRTTLPTWCDAQVLKDLPRNPFDPSGLSSRKPLIAGDERLSLAFWGDY